MFAMSFPRKRDGGIQWLNSKRQSYGTSESPSRGRQVTLRMEKERGLNMRNAALAFFLVLIPCSLHAQDKKSDWKALYGLRSGEKIELVERSEEHTSELQSRLHLVCRLLLEKKNGIEIAPEADRIGASIATGIGGIKSFQDCYDTLIERGPDRVNPFAIPCIIPNMGAGWVSMQLGTRGPLSSECTACAASNMAIGQGLDDIRLGRADVMLCGGTESAINKVGIAGFGAMRALSRRNDDPKRASRPFDAERDGFVMGEAGALVVLEELEHARARGAKIYAEIVGYGLSADASHVTEPDPTGISPARAMTMAFGDAGIEPAQIGYINAHGTSTPLGDSAET